MPDATLATIFVLGAALSLGAAWVLVSRLERLGARLGLSEALLGLLAALAADAPEITAAVTALGAHRSQIGTGVVIGSNVFNLAALLGIAAVVAGSIALHRRVILMQGAVALWIAAMCTVVIVGALPAAVGLVLVLAVFVPYIVLIAVSPDRLARSRLPSRWITWLVAAVHEEELELEPAIHPERGRVLDAVEALVAVIVVVGASIAMEQSAATLGSRHAVPDIVVGGLVLAAVTSLPNAVAAIYLAVRGRAVATFSTALSSNALNPIAGLLVPATVVGLGVVISETATAAVWYLALTAFTLACAYICRGLVRAHGAMILAAYLSFVGMVIAIAYSSPAAAGLSTVPLLAATLFATAGLLRDRPALDPSQPRLRDRSLLGESWSVRRVWLVALSLNVVIGAVDAALGHLVLLVGLQVAGPCFALLTGRWTKTALVSVWAVGLAVLVGVPDRIWGTKTAFAFLVAVALTGVICTACAAIIQHRGRSEMALDPL